MTKIRLFIHVARRCQISLATILWLMPVCKLTSIESQAALLHTEESLFGLTKLSQTFDDVISFSSFVQILLLRCIC